MVFASLFRRVASGEVSPADAAALVDATVALVQRTPLPRPFDNAPDAMRFANLLAEHTGRRVVVSLDTATRKIVVYPSPDGQPEGYVLKDIPPADYDWTRKQFGDWVTVRRTELLAAIGA